MNKQSREWRNALIAVAVAFAVAFTLMGLAHPAWAHADADWIQKQQLRNSVGEWCCGINDCDPVNKADYTESVNGWTITKTKEVIPYSESMPLSIDGRLWVCRKNDGTRRCVFHQPPGM